MKSAPVFGGVNEPLAPVPVAQDAAAFLNFDFFLPFHDSFLEPLSIEQTLSSSLDGQPFLESPHNSCADLTAEDSDRVKEEILAAAVKLGHLGEDRPPQLGDDSKGTQEGEESENKEGETAAEERDELRVFSCEPKASGERVRVQGWVRVRARRASRAAESLLNALTHDRRTRRSLSRLTGGAVRARVGGVKVTVTCGELDLIDAWDPTATGFVHEPLPAATPHYTPRRRASEPPGRRALPTDALDALDAPPPSTRLARRHTSPLLCRSSSPIPSSFTGEACGGLEITDD